MAAEITSNMTQEGLEKIQKDFEADQEKFFADNKDKFEIIKQKEANGEELTEEEKYLKELRDNYYTPMTSGTISGTAINQNISAEFKKEFLEELNKNAFKYADTYKDVMKLVSDFVDDYAEEHPEMNVSKEELAKLLDETTNGNYSIVTSGSETELNAPEEKTEQSSPAIGFSQKEVPDTDVLKEIKAAVIKKEEPQKFTVEKSTTNPIVSSTEADVEAIKKEKTTVKKLKALNKSGLWNVPFVRKLVANSLARITNPLRVLQDLPSDMVKDIASSLVRKGKLNEEEIQKLNLSINEKQLLINEYQKTQKTKEEAAV